MTPRAHKYLLDVRLAIEAVEDFVRDTPDFTAYQADHKTRSAVERQLAIVGKAVNHLRREWPEVNLPNYEADDRLSQPAYPFLRQH